MGFTTLDFVVGDRVRLAPHTDLWMRGMRYGTVTRITPRQVFIQGDNGRRYGLLPDMIVEIIVVEDRRRMSN